MRKVSRPEASAAVTEKEASARSAASAARPAVFSQVMASLLPAVPKRNSAFSAKTGQGIDALFAVIERELCKGRRRAVFLLPYSLGGMVETLHDKAQVLRVDYTAEGIEIEAEVDEVLFGRLAQYEIVR